jgi:hypothetical protein
MRIPGLWGLTAALTAIGLGVSTTCCAGTVAAAGTPEVSKGTVQTQSAKILASETGQKPPTVTCPSGLAAKVDAVLHCTVVPNGMTITYPVTITVRSIHGKTAHFYVQVGQAPGQADRTKFCADNATITRSLTAAKTERSFLSALQATMHVFLDLQAHAPAKAVASAGTLIAAARQAVQSGSSAVFDTKTVTKAVLAIESFCGQGTGG